MTLQLAAPSAEAGRTSRDSLGCLQSHLDDDKEISGSGITFYRKSSPGGSLGRVEMPANDRGYLVGVSLRKGHRRRIFHEHHSVNCAFEENAIYIRSFADDYRADMETSFDFLLLEISQPALDLVTYEGGGPLGGLAYTQGRLDPVLPHLARARLPAFDGRRETNPLFIDQLSLAIQTHLVSQYGATRAIASRPGRSLSRAQEALAKELLAGNLNGDVLIGDIAAVCNLSRSYFIRAFKETTGCTPYQWLLTHRIEQACQQLRSPQRSLADVAMSCGFADQSHFTRTFSRIMGVSPGLWRKQR